MVKQLFDCGFSTGEILQKLKCLGNNKIFIYSTKNRLLEVNSCKDRACPAHPGLACIKE